jgi:membrane protease YdiL (CAAX protease family)
MKTGSATGAQVAFLTFALLMLVVPLSRWAKRYFPGPTDAWALVERALPFAFIAVALFGVTALRRACLAELSRPIPDDRRSEVALATAGHLALGFAWAGLYVLWWWIAEGPLSVEQRIGGMPPHQAEMARASTGVEVIRSFVLPVLVAPLLEELVFRGFLYRAWEKQWGWLASMALTSTLFACYHPNFLPSFTASLLYVALYRRTGTLWAPIVAHAAFNGASYYPLLGQLVFQRSLEAPGDLGAWGFHLACVMFVAVALPIYVWMARDDRGPANLAGDHEPLPQ